MVISKYSDLLKACDINRVYGPLIVYSTIHTERKIVGIAELVTELLGQNKDHRVKASALYFLYNVC